MLLDKVKVRKSLEREKIISEVCEYYSMPTENINIKRRTHPLREARQIIMYILNIQYRHKSTEIAKALSMDHTTVLYNCQAVQNMLDTNYLPADHIIYKYIKKS